MRDLLPSLFLLAAGLGGVAFGVTAVLVRRANRALWPRLQLVGLLAMPFGFYLMAQAVSKSTLGRAGPLLATGGGILLLGAVFVAVGLVLATRQTQQ